MKIKSNIIRFIGSHRFLNRKLRFILPDISSIEINRNFNLFFDPKDLYGPSYYVMYGKAGGFYHYEEELKAELVQCMSRDAVFFDVGANIGLITFFIKKFFPQAHIHSFEPGKIMMKCFEATLTSNKIEKVKLVKKGVAEKTGTAEFFIDPKSTGGSSIARKHFEKNNRNIESIELISLDDYVQASGVIPTLVKVDVEGAESRVVEGARTLIANHRPKFIIEVDHQNTLDSIELWQTTFENYVFRPIATTELYPITDLKNKIQAQLNRGIKGFDYLFIPKEKI